MQNEPWDWIIKSNKPIRLMTRKEAYNAGRKAGMEEAATKEEPMGFFSNNTIRLRDGDPPLIWQRKDGSIIAQIDGYNIFPREIP